MVHIRWKDFVPKRAVFGDIFYGLKTLCRKLRQRHTAPQRGFHCPDIHEDVARHPQRPHSATQPRNVVSLPDIREDAARAPQRLVRAGAGYVCRYRLKRGRGFPYDGNFSRI